MAVPCPVGRGERVRSGGGPIGHPRKGLTTAIDTFTATWYV